MSGPDPGLSHHPAPQRGRTGGWETAFSLFGGPLAWFLQLNASYLLMSTPCYPSADRNVALPAEAMWVWPLAVGTYLLCLAIALASGVVALKLFRRTRDESAGAEADVEEAGTGRTRFLAYWGLLLGFGFSVVIFVNAIALALVPPCVL